MAGSILRLTIFVVFSSLLNFTLLQQPVSFIQNPFRLNIDIRKEFRERSQDLFPYSPSSSVIKLHIPPRSFAPRRQRSYYVKPSLTSSYTTFRKISPNTNIRNRRIYNNINGKFPNQKYYALPNNFKNISYSNINKNRYSVISLTNNTKLKPTNNNINNNNNNNRNFHRVNNVINRTENHKYYNKNKNYTIVTQKPPNPAGATENSWLSAKRNKSKNKKEETKTSFLGYVISALTQLPVIGNVLRASVDPLYRPIVNRLQSDNETIMRGENDMKNWCFGELGCIRPSIDFYHPLYRPMNLPPYPREKIATEFSIHSRNDSEGHIVPAMAIKELFNTTFVPSRPTKIIIHGYLNYKSETWILEMVRGLLKHGDYNIIVVDWSGGSYALYSQATANIRVVALEVSRLLSWLRANYRLDVSNVHIIGHSLGSHTAGYVGERIKGIGRITGLDPAEPFFQYMPNTVRLDPSDAKFVDVIHTDINPFFALTGPRGFGLQQPVGHVDFYPNGGKEQPGCNQLLARVPMTLMMEGRDIIEGMNAAHTELLNCDHVRSTKLFTDSLVSECPYLGFICPSYQDYKDGKCFTCGPSGEDCAFMGINADYFHPSNRTNVKVFLDTHYAPHFCKYHYILTIDFADPNNGLGTLRGRLKISLIDEDGQLKKFDLTSLSPLKFPRRGSRTFLLDHYEDLSGTHEALINWIYESDLLDPLSYCVLFCKADLSIASVSVKSVDSMAAANEIMALQSGLIRDRSNPAPFSGSEIVMCHKQGEEVVSIPSEKSVKISASPSCRDIQRRSFFQY